MTRTSQLRLMARVARLYHEQDVRQTDIAAQLDLSQSRVSRLLRQAAAEGIVRTSIVVPPGCHLDLEAALRDAFRLREAVVVDADPDAESDVMRAIGSAAAAYLDATLGADEVVGLSSTSRTLLHLVEQLPPRSRPSARGVVQLTGGVGDPAEAAHAGRLARRLADRLRSSVHVLPAPALPGSRSARRAIAGDATVRGTIERFPSVSCAVVGIGGLESPSAFTRAVAGSADMEELSALGAAAEICLRFVDDAGRPVASSVDDRLIGVALEDLRVVPRCVAVAGGRLKVRAIGAALRSEVVDVLVTDRASAEALLRRPAG